MWSKSAKNFRGQQSRAGDRVFLALSWLVFCLWIPAGAVYQETTEYFPAPESYHPLEGLLPDKGMEPPRGPLKINSQYLKRRHNVNFDTREVEIVEYVRVGNEGDPGADSTVVWQAYYRELNAYSTDMHDLLLRRRWLLEFMGKDEAAPGGTPGTFVFDLPFRVPDWMRRVGVDKPKLTINGSYKLVLEGSRRSGSGVPFASGWFPNLHMDQQPLFSVKGSIGRLISVEINSEDGLGTNLKEQLKISYKGEGDELEDDVIQEIEAGNTSLSLSGTNLTGYTENHKGLFGVKIRLKVGDLEITGIASQEGGTQERQKLGAGTEAREFTVEDKAIDFFRHFWLMHSDRAAYGKAENWGGTSNLYVQGGRNRRTVDVFELATSTEPNLRDSATACAYDEAGNATTVCESGRWKQLKEGVEFIYDEDLRMLTVPGGHRDITLAVRWENDFIMQATGAVRRDLTKLILVYSRNQQGTPVLDSLMWRNVYSLTRVTPQDRDQFRLTMVDNEGRDRAPGDSITYIRRLGLEKRDQPGKLDVDNKLIFKLDEGYVVLPCLTNGVAGGDPANCLVPMRRVRPEVNLYAETAEEVQNGPSASKFIGFGKQRKSTFDVRENSYSASGQQCFDIEQGTERLVLNGSTVLQKGLDYEVIYESGQITLTSARARDPNADLEISYECNPPFQIQDKILLGARMEYKLDGISDQSLIGATVLYKSQTTTERQPELGHEPFSQALFGLNTRLAGEPKWMTRFANLFPLVHTEARSKANFEFEIAHSLVNPNSKNDAYLDNFDFSEQQSSLPMYPYYSWSKASPPIYDRTGLPDETLDFRHQGGFIWHSSVKEQYYRIYGNTGNDYTNSREQTLLKFSFLPNDNLEGNSWGGVMRAFTQGFTNQSRKRTLEIVVQGREGTLYADLGRISEDISIKGLPPPSGKSPGEPDGYLQTEVSQNSSSLVNTRDAGLDGKSGPDEKYAVNWECKPACYAITLDTNDLDPSHDNWSSPEGGTTEESSVNGTEGNDKGNQGLTFDTEDLDRSGGLDVDNRYLRFSMPLDSGCYARYYCEELRNGWRKYSIPLYGGGVRIDPANTETEQSILSNVKMLRLWVGKLPARISGTELLLAKVNLVGNIWEAGERNTAFEVDANRFGSGDLDSNFIRTPPIVRDSNNLRVDVLNRQEERGYKQSPQTPRERDTRTDEPLPERTLVMRYENLHPGEAAGATRVLANDPKDLTQYDRISLEVHSDSNWASNAPKYQPGQNKVSLGLRLGRDQGNRDSRDYYEIRIHMDDSAQLDPEHRALWLRNSFTVKLSDLTALKNDPLYRAYTGRRVSQSVFNAARGDSSLTLSVVGDPNLSRVDWMRLVVYVDSAATEFQRGEIWVNDLRLEGVDRSAGTAIRSQIQLDFADFIGVSGNLQYTNGNFTTLSQQKATPANSATKVDYNTSVSLYANKFMPDAWAVSLPISFQVRGALDRPFTRPYSDLGLQGTGLFDITQDLLDGRLSSIHDPADSLKDIEDRNARVYQNTTFEKRFSLSYKKEQRVDNFFTRALLERPDMEYRFAGSERTEYFKESESRDYKVTLRYNLSPHQNRAYKPFGFSEKWKYMPGGISGMDFTPMPEKFNLVLANYSFVRDFTLNKPRNSYEPTQAYPPQYQVELSHGLDLEWRPLSFFNFGYRVDIARDFDRERECFDADHFFDMGSESCGGAFAKGLIFDWDQGSGRPEYYDQTQPDANPVLPPITTSIDTSHYGQEFLILARERNRTQSFHSDVNLNPLSWLTVGSGFNSGYRHTWTDRQNDGIGTSVAKPAHFEANADHDVRLTTGVNITSLVGSLGKFLEPVRQQLDKHRLRNVDLTYTVSNKYNNEAFTYRYLKDKGVDYNLFMAYQLGFVYAPSTLGTLFSGEPDPTSFDYLSRPDPALGQTAMNHVVNRALDLSSGFTIPMINLDLTGSLKYQKQYTLYRYFQASDTTITWPEYTVTGSFGDFASKLPGLRRSLRSLTAYSSYNYREETRFSLFSPSPDVDKVAHRWNPLLRLTATANNDMRIEVSFTGSYEKELQKGKVSDTLQIRPLTYESDTNKVARRNIYRYDPAKESPKHLVSAGVEPTLSWDLETQKGIQFWRYYIKLKNNLRITINGAVNYTLSEIEENGYTHKDKNQISAMIKPEASYNFTNNVDAKFWTQYKFDQFYNTPKDEYVHDLAVHGEFTMRF